MLELGGKATSTALKSDLVFYTSNDIKSSFEKTGCNLVEVYGSNVTAIRQFLSTTWADLIEKNYTQKVGINVSLQRSRINASDNATLHRIEIGKGGVPLLVTDLNKNVAHNSTLGPVISSYNNPPSIPSLLFPISGWTTNGALLLNWSDSTDPENDNVTYQVEVNTSNNYTNASYLTVNLLNGTYYWKVKATDGIENLTFADVCASAKRSSWTASWNFTVDSSAPSLTLKFVDPPYPCRVKTGGDKPVRVEANVTSQGNPIADASVTVELIMGGVVVESDTMQHIGNGIYGEGSTYWQSETEIDKNDVVTVRVTALRNGYASARIELEFRGDYRQCP
ncbi:MAG: hypothetical protein ABIH76_08310 [Candidatus Bathyarchaeota archaeon]